MAFAVVLPKMGMPMVEGTITEWFVSDGDTVAEGDPLFSFETEKVDYEVTAEAAGNVRLLQAVDAVVEAGGLCAYILAEGEELPEGVVPAPAPAAAAQSAPASAGAAPSAPAPASAGATTAVKASPVAKRLAAERGIDLATIAGSGPGGRILKEDVEAAPAAVPAAPASSILSSGDRVV